MDKIKIGIIGTGVGIRTHYNGFKLFEEEAEVYAISGSSLKRSREFALKYDIPVACKDYKELCDIDELDLVCITAPNKFHKEMIEQAVSKHKNIICEKPIVDDLKETEYINSLLKGYDKLFVVDHQLRFNPYILKIKELIESGKLGKIYNVRINQQGTGFANKDAKYSWSFDSEEGGGVRLAMASHFTDLIQFLFSSRKVLSVMASLNPVTKERIDNEGNLKNITASTTCNAFITLEDELTCQYYINAGSYDKSRFDINIFGDEGEITFSLDDKLKLYLRDNTQNCESVNVEDVYEDEKENRISIFSGSFRYFAPQIIKAIKTKDTKYVSDATKVEDYLYTMKILDAIKKSANTGSSISFGKEENIYS